VLKVNKDYTLTHSNNVNAVDINDAEPAKAIVRLSNNYKYNGVVGAEVIKEFGILPAKINNVKATAQWFKGDGVAVESPLVVKAGNIVLTEEDYVAAYDKHEAVGTAQVIVKAKDGSNYTGEKKATYKIAKENVSKATVEGVTDLTYTGSALEQTSMIVRNQAGEIIPASDYELTYKNNTKAGKASITIKADSNSIYTGSKNVSFTIKPAALSEILVVQDGVLYDKKYNGKKQTYTTKELQKAFKKEETGALIPSSAYKITYSNNINAGHGIMTLTGKGNYTGTKTILFTINQKDIKGLKVYIEGTAKYIDSNTAAIPNIRYITDGK